MYYQGVFVRYVYTTWMPGHLICLTPIHKLASVDLLLDSCRMLLNTWAVGGTELAQRKLHSQGNN